MLERIRRLIGKRDWVQAEFWLNQIDPFHAPLTASWFISCHENMGNGIAADMAAVKALDAFPESCTLHGQYAKRLQARNELERACRHYGFMRRKWPGYAPAWYEQIKCLWLLGRHGEAEPLLTEIVKKYPADLEAHRLCAENLTRKRQWEQALAKWAEITEKFPASPVGLRRSIDIHVATGNLEKADAMAKLLHNDAEAVSGSCFIRRKAGSPDVLIIFAAFDIALGNFPGGNGLFTPAEFGANIIILNDVHKRWYLDGIYGLGNNFREAAARLDEIRKSLLGPGGHTICYGNSMGAYGACLYGSLIGADICLGPGLQALAPNPVGTFKKYAGRRPHLEDFIADAPTTYFHVIVGEREFGDLFGCMRLAGLKNVNLEAVKNAGHGVSDYFTTKRGIREALHLYLDGLRSNPEYIHELVEGKRRWKAIGNDDKGDLVRFPKIGAWLYGALIALIYPARKDHAKFAAKLIAVAECCPSGYIKGYLFEMAARLYHKAGDDVACLRAGRTALAYNRINPYANEFLAQIALANKKNADAFQYAQQAISIKDTTLSQGVYRPNHCYDSFMRALVGLGEPELALESCDGWLLRRGMTAMEQNFINSARNQCLEELAKINSEQAAKYRLWQGEESWRWQLLSQFWEWARDYDQAVYALRKAIAKSPGDRAWLLKLVDLHRLSGDDNSAREVALAEIAKSDWGVGYRRLAQICLVEGDFAKALEYGLKAREVEPQNAFHDLLLGELYARLGDFGKAMEYVLPYIDDKKMRPHALAQLDSIKALESASSPVTQSRSRPKPVVDPVMEREALWLALDLEPKRLDLRLRLAKNLRPMTFVGALKVLDAGLAISQDWHEGRLLRDQYALEQSEWQKAHAATA